MGQAGPLRGLPAGTYTLTPSKAGYTFVPAASVVSVPPGATDQDFVGIASVYLPVVLRPQQPNGARIRPSRPQKSCLSTKVEHLLHYVAVSAIMAGEVALCTIRNHPPAGVSGPP